MKKLIHINTKLIYFFVLGLIVITRCYGSGILSNQIKEILFISVTALALISKKIQFSIQDGLWLVTGVIVLFHHSSTYPDIYIVFYICALLSRFIVKRNIYDVEILLKILLFFSLVTSVVSWISLLLPSLYTGMIVPFINPSGQAEVLHELSIGNLAGLTDHYSRNAYYVVCGILVLISKIWTKTGLKFSFRKNIKVWILVLFELITLLAIGKRGHLIFLLLTAYVTFLIFQKTYSAKVINSLKAVVIVVIAVIIIFGFIPQAQHTLERLILMSESDDISTGRVSNYIIAFSLFKQNPIFGIGYGGFNQLTASGLTKYTYAGVHNDYIQFLCETGIVGFMLFIGLGIFSLIMSGLTLKRIVRNDEYIGSKIKCLAIWSFMFQFFVLAYSMTGLPHFDFETNTVYLVSCGLSAAISKMVKSKKSIKLKERGHLYEKSWNYHPVR